MYAETDCYELHSAKGDDMTKYALVNILSYDLRRKRAIFHKFRIIPRVMM